KFREPGESERAALMDLRDALAQLPAGATAAQIQEVVYEVGRREPFLDKTGKIKTRDGKPGVALDWFNMLYQVLLGQEKGPRFGLLRGLIRRPKPHRHDRRCAGPLGLTRAPNKMPPAALAVIGVTIICSSFISGIFGMAGGMILLGVLLNYFDVATG